jgi:hypothetical protein
VPGPDSELPKKPREKKEVFVVDFDEEINFDKHLKVGTRKSSIPDMLSLFFHIKFYIESLYFNLYKYMQCL